MIDVHEIRSHETGPAVEAEAAVGIEVEAGLVVVGEEIELLRQRRLILEAVLPGGGDERPLIARLPARQLEARERELVPAVEERGRRGIGAGFEEKDAAVPVLPVGIGDDDTEILGDRFAQVVARAVEDPLAVAVDPLAARFVEAELALLRRRRTARR